MKKLNSLRELKLNSNPGTLKIEMILRKKVHSETLLESKQNLRIG
jgi:hypothetical protein